MKVTTTEEGRVIITLSVSEAHLLYEEVARLPVKLLKIGSSRKLLQVYRALESMLTLITR